jgi:hypothetical protein
VVIRTAYGQPSEAREHAIWSEEAAARTRVGGPIVLLSRPRHHMGRCRTSLRYPSVTPARARRPSFVYRCLYSAASAFCASPVPRVTSGSLARDQTCALTSTSPRMRQSADEARLLLRGHPEASPVLPRFPGAAAVLRSSGCKASDDVEVWRGGQRTFCYEPRPPLLADMLERLAVLYHADRRRVATVRCNSQME